ncbi:MAG: transposase [Phycisphaerales bacterium]|nr:transposase [Phycisphaerales bacterium]
MAKRRHRKRYEHSGDGRYLTFSCYRRLPLFGNDRIKDAFALQLEERHQIDHFRLVAWVVMPEHVHLLLIPATGQVLSTVLGPLKEPFAMQILDRWRTLEAPILPRLLDSNGHSHFWQRGGGYDRNIVTESELFEKVEYIHQNPVRRGLVKRSTDWPWSSARWYAGDRSGPVTIDSFRP